MTDTSAKRFRKLPARYAGIVQPFILSGCMSLIVSGFATFRAIGIPQTFMSDWLKAWWPSWIIAFMTLMVILPFVRRLTAMLVDMPNQSQGK